MSKLTRDGTGRLNPFRETKFSGTHGDRGIFIFPVQLTTSRIGNLTRFIHTLLCVMNIHTYILAVNTSRKCFPGYVCMSVQQYFVVFIVVKLTSRKRTYWLP